MADDGKIYGRYPIYILSLINRKVCGFCDRRIRQGRLRKSQSVYIVKGMCLFNQNKLSPARTALYHAVELRVTKDKTNQRICGQWITFIDRESKRQAQLAAASG